MTAHLQLAAASTTSTGEAFQFWVLGTVAVIGALCTVFMKRAVHSALSLASTMIILAIFYLANGAYFLGIVQIVVYTGAIMMLFLFVLMLVGRDASDSLIETLRGQRMAAVVLGIGFALLIGTGLARALGDAGNARGLAEANRGGNVQGIAALLFTKYVFAFEVTSALLITAAVGAMILAHVERRREDKVSQSSRMRAGSIGSRTWASSHQMMRAPRSTRRVSRSPSSPPVMPYSGLNGGRSRRSAGACSSTLPKRSRLSGTGVPVKQRGQS